MRPLYRIARRANVVLVPVLLVSLAVAYAVPQQPETLDESRWPSLLQPAAGVLRWAGADRVFGSWWFHALLAIIAIVSLVMLIDQARVAWRRLFDVAEPPGIPRTLSHADADAALVRARRRGYLPVRRGAGMVKIVKNPWGHWGATLLHGGIVVATLASWFALQTTSTGVIQLAEGESFVPGQEWGLAEQGALAEPLVFSGTMELEGVETRYWPDGALRQIGSEISVSSGGATRVVKLAVNDSAVVDGVRVYQSQRSGPTLLLTIIGPSGQEDLRTDLERPGDPDTPSYDDLPLADGSLLRIKYLVADVAGATPETVEVVARVEKDGEVLGQEALTVGEPAALGEYSVTLVDLRSWTQLIAVRTQGMGVVFTGFGIILLGSLLLYVWPPRELHVRFDDTEARVWSRAWRFPDVYSEEIARVLGDTGEGDDDD